MIKCISFLWQRSPLRFAAAIIFTLLSGFSGIAMLAVANVVLQGRPVSRTVIIWSFIGICLLLPLSRFTAEMFISRLAQSSVFELQMRLSRKIAAAPLRFLEDYGMHRLLAVMMQDVPVFGFALLTIPTTCLNLTILAGGLIYMGWLSPFVLITVLGFIEGAVPAWSGVAARAVAWDEQPGADDGERDLPDDQPPRPAGRNRCVDAPVPASLQPYLAGPRRQRRGPDGAEWLVLSADAAPLWR